MIPRKGKPSQARHAEEHRKPFRRTVKWRTGSEGRISCLKRSYGWDRARIDGTEGARIWTGHGRDWSGVMSDHAARAPILTRLWARTPASLIALADDLPVPVLADVLGLSLTTAQRWAALAQRDWAAYIAERVTAISPGDGEELGTTE